MSKKGGYQIISLLQPVLLYALTLSNGKPVLLTDINIGGVKKKDVFAQVEQVTEEGETKYVLKNVYGYDLTIDSEGEITWVKKELLIENIKDKDGHNRFIEGNITMKEIEGITWLYNKWSLSGSHLIIVLAGSVLDATTISTQTITKSFVGLPQWIIDKIVSVFSIVVELKTINAYNSDYTSQSMNYYLEKVSNNIQISMSGFTATKDRGFRVSFDLLIDNE